MGRLIIRLSILSVLVFTSVASIAQTPPGYTKINARYNWIAGRFDSAFHMPIYDTVPNVRRNVHTGAGNIGLDTINNVIYYYSSGQWWNLIRGFDIDGEFVTDVTATGLITSSEGEAPNISTSMTQNKLVGRGAASGTGIMQEITLGTLLSITGTTLNVTEVDGSVSNELQTFTTDEFLSGFRATLSGSGGSFRIIPGTGITITTGGTALDGTATINATTSAAPTSLGPIGSTPNANGMTLASNVLNLEPASSSFGGVVVTGAQTFPDGIKTFQKDINVYNSIQIGRGAGSINTNIVFGEFALDANTTGFQNIGMGYLSMANNTDGSQNVAIGYSALRDNIGGGLNTAIGTTALLKNTSGFSNVAVGSGALGNITTGNSATAFGVGALANATGSFNTAIGANSMQTTTTAEQSVGVGLNSLKFNTTGGKNTAVGVGSMENTSTGEQNTGLGQDALLGNVGGSNNTAVGWLAGASGTTRSRNVSFGSSAGRSTGVAYTGSNNTFIGTEAAYHASQKTDAENSIAIGQGSYTTKDSLVVLGASFIEETWLRGNVGVNNESPTEKLDVTGNVRFSGALMPNNLAGTSGYNLTSQGAGTAPVWVAPPVLATSDVSGSAVVELTGGTSIKFTPGTDITFGIGGTTDDGVLTINSGLTFTDANGFDFTKTVSAISVTTTVANTRLVYSSSGAVAGVSGVTSDGTNVTAGDGNLRATSPWITTGLDDQNGAVWLKSNFAASAVNYYGISNGATGTGLTITTEGPDTNIPMFFFAKGTADYSFKGSTSPAVVNIMEAAANGSHVVGLAAPAALAGSTVYTLPTGFPGSTGHVLSSTTGGVMSWVANGGGATLNSLKRVVTVTQSATPTINTDNTDIASITGLAQAITSMTTNLSGSPAFGNTLTVYIVDDGTDRAITWGASFGNGATTLPTTTEASVPLWVQFYRGASTWDCMAKSY